MIPSWYYKPIVVDNLNLIQEEFKKILPKLINTNEEISFFYIKRNIIESNVPSYVKLITDLGLIDRWVYSAVIITEGGKKFPIHVDALDWKNRCFGLNLPIQNCHDSWTVWYDAKVDQTPKLSDERESARICIEKDAREVCRMPANTPAWTNNTIPHRPYTEHNELRVIVSARFSPELHDYFKD